MCPPRSKSATSEIEQKQESIDAQFMHGDAQMGYFFPMLAILNSIVLTWKLSSSKGMRMVMP